MVKTTLTGKVNASFLPFKQKLSYKRVEGGIKLVIPKSLRLELAKQEATVFKITN
jgi:alpha-L-fucosidase